MAEAIVVCGATGRQGGSVTRRLLQDGWTVRALTRKPDSKKAGVLAGLGAQVVKGDMDDPKSLRDAFDGAYGVYSVQNGIASGFDKEVSQGRNVADATKATGIRHLVYGSAGSGKAGTGVPSWEAKIPVEEHLRDLNLPFTILRPLAFMELMTDPAFYPAVGTWRIFPKLTGEQRGIPWLSVDDLGAITATVFAKPNDFLGRELTLTTDVQSLAECRSLYREIMGKEPRTFPMPLWLFDRFTRSDPTTMWRWLRAGQLEFDTGLARSVLPTALTVREWLLRIRHAASQSHVQEKGQP